MTLDPDVFTPMVKNVARSVSGQFPSVDREDTEQALWLWLYEKRASVVKTVEDSPQDWEPKIASTMRKVASDHCARERAATEGCSTEDLYRYSVPKIKNLMPDVFNHSDWQTFGNRNDGQPMGKPLANRTGDRLAELVDVKAAVQRLPIETKELLYLVHVLQYTAENLGDHFEISLEAAKKRLQRAYRATQRALGRREEAQGTPRRVVRSNASWRASTASQWEG